MTHTSGLPSGAPGSGEPPNTLAERVASVHGATLLFERGRRGTIAISDLLRSAASSRSPQFSGCANRRQTRGCARDVKSARCCGHKYSGCSFLCD
jgi:hypothetical protein